MTIRICPLAHERSFICEISVIHIIRGSIIAVYAVRIGGGLKGVILISFYHSKEILEGIGVSRCKLRIVGINSKFKIVCTQADIGAGPVRGRMPPPPMFTSEKEREGSTIP